MKKLYIVANWKSNKTEAQAREWLERFKIDELGTTDKEIIICPPFTLLSFLKSYILNHKSPIKLGAQDISPFEEGAYTGEVNGKQIKEFADYVIIGHSEKQKYFGETNETILKKISLAIQYGLTPIVCTANPKQIHNSIHNSTTLVVYEPPGSISPGPADSPENAEQVGMKFCQVYNTDYVLYGGNVTSENVQAFTAMPHINGVLVGRASLDASQFATIVTNA